MLDSKATKPGLGTPRVKAITSNVSLCHFQATTVPDDLPEVIDDFEIPEEEMKLISEK